MMQVRPRFFQKSRINKTWGISVKFACSQRTPVQGVTDDQVEQRIYRCFKEKSDRYINVWRWFSGSAA